MLSRIIERVREAFTSSREISREPRIYTRSEHRIDPRLVSPEAVKACEALHRRGYKAYIVGGAVRDLLLGVTPKDFDIATDATPEQVKRCQRRALIIGRRFQIVHVIFGNEIIECSTFRALEGAGQRKDSTGRVLSDNVFGEQWEDAARRDFTCNALYYDPKTEELLDYHHGYEDIKAGVLRIIGDPEVRYREDPVRMMRAIRISAKLGFKIDDKTGRPIPKMGYLLNNVPNARMVDEILKLLTCGHAVECFERLQEEGLAKVVFPMLDLIVGEPDGMAFLMLALKRTDERIAIGKKISPFFLFATLLWPQVLKRWRHNEQVRGMKHLQALYYASEEVLATQSLQLNIQRRFQVDMNDVWIMQGRLEKRTGKSPFSVANHPRYRAAYDFLMLRVELGHVDPEVGRWWAAFEVANEVERHQLIAQAQDEARHTGEKAKSMRNRRVSTPDTVEGGESSVMPASVLVSDEPNETRSSGVREGREDKARSERSRRRRRSRFNHRKKSNAKSRQPID